MTSEGRCDYEQTTTQSREPEIFDSVSYQERYCIRSFQAKEATRAAGSQTSHASRLARLICRFFRHDFRFRGGYWVLGDQKNPQYATTIRTCVRCGLTQEVGQDHVNGLAFLDSTWYEPLLFRKGK